MSRKKKIGLVLLSLILIMQFIRPGKNGSGAPSEPPGRAFEEYNAVPVSTAHILKTSCYDCHSNYTKYPWYAEVQPVGWWLQHHVDEGKEELNFDEYNSYSPRRKFHKLEEIEEMLGEKEMPLSSYTLVHGDAELSAAQGKELVDWSRALRDSLKAHYPPDSLKMKRR